jgi:cell division septal protein FtsQ
VTDGPAARRPAGPAARRTRPPVPARRTKPVRRASPRLSVARAAAALAMLASAGAIYGVGASSAFEYTDLRVDGALFTDVAAAEAAIADSEGQNLFRLSTEPLEMALEGLPTVDRAQVTVQLPGTLVVTLRERVPVLVWRVGARRYLADATGSLFARLDDDPPPEAAELPVIDDRRAASAGLSVGARLDPQDLDAATRLASLVPNDVGSAAESLSVRVTDENGFVVRADPQGWLAIFGFYTPSLRTPDLIPGQVRLLRSLLIGREPLIARVILASETDGTYVPKPTPRPNADPSASPGTS